MLTVAVAATLWGLLVSLGFTIPSYVVVGRTLFIAFVLLLVFSLLEQWPRQLPGWFARWVLQVLGVAVAVPPTVLLLYLYCTGPAEVPLWQDKQRLSGLATLSVSGLLFAPWFAAAALLRQRDSTVRNQALSFQLERERLERRALDARLRLLQAQVQPHFLFNTLANVRELVDSGSPQASAVLGSLIAYLRAAVPRLNDPDSTVAQELELLRAYLAIMHLRMPDRLQYSLHADEAALALRCPPTCLLTLVENAVRHGIDPSEEGGRIDVRVQVRNGRCLAQVSDTGVGLHAGSAGLGTGLATLRERLQLSFGPTATLSLTPQQPHGVCAELDFPAQRGQA
ncbi:sensor histidine kinase [Tahibacter harae]|uniref:Histidine kinase n=1 Tax=Tahibacter harae TaxID=2963937 RepID=A0ABT1QUW0_9GAMM|nr:histidine kinase [Tahibacter harae]